ncbi:hypothetical protein G6F60_000886 [Rhizopus arrhizus]|nr:hypothetical protein G6F60_000886 [Rhizopus arrhizus]
MSKGQDSSESLDEEVYEVESLRGHRVSTRDNNSLEYLIKWKHYGEEYNTWERERNIFAKGLILEYWRKQQANSSKDTLDEQSKVESIINAKLSAKPPEKRTWNDIDCVVNVYHCGNSILFAEVKWKSDEEYDRVNNTFIPTRILRKTCPLKANSDNFPHLLFYGPPGAGKKTRIAAVLREIYGPSTEKLKVEQRQFVTSSNRKMIFTVVSSNYHLELNPSDLGIYDRVIVQDVIKSIAQTQQFDVNARHQFKVIIIDHADELTRNAQAALRRTMEKYTSSIRLILCCNSLSKIIAPVRSRCLLMRVARPEVDEVVGALLHVATKENFSLPRQLAISITEHAERNMRSSLLSLESTAVRHPDLSKVTQIDELDWEIAISKMTDMMIKEPTPASLITIRQHLYDLVIKYIEPTVILKKLAFVLMNKVDNSLKLNIIERAAYYEHRMSLGKKETIYLEMFITSVMHVCKRFLNEM